MINPQQQVIYDPSMSTCSILQPHHDFVMSDVQYAIIPPSPDTVFALLNCSIDSPVLNHYKSLCFNFSGHSCDELYGSCTAFRLFHLLSNTTPPCCFTGYNTVKYMSMNILDCSHYTSVYGVDGLKGVGPLDWLYGIKLSYSVPDTGCDLCAKSGGTCGYDVETQGMVCICSNTLNSTRVCGKFHKLQLISDGKYSEIRFLHRHMIFSGVVWRPNINWLYTESVVEPQFYSSESNITYKLFKKIHQGTSRQHFWNMN